MTRGARLLCVCAAACALAPAATAAGTPILLPSVRTTLTPGPPLTAANVSGEVLYPPGMTSDQKVLVGVDSAGKPVSLHVVQRLELPKLGDYSFTVPGPISDVEVAPGSDSQPGLRQRRDSLVGLLRRQEDARRARDAASRRRGVTPAAPRVGRARRRTRLIVRGENVAVARAPVLVGPLSLSEAAKALRQTRKYLHARRRGAGPVRDRARRRRSRRSERIVAPLDVQGQVGERTLPLRPRRRPAASVRAAHRARARKARSSASSSRRCRRNGSCARGRDDVERALALVARARLTVARELQFHNFLANPNPTGRSTATYVYETAKRSAAPKPVTPADDGGNSSWPAFLAVALGVVGAGTLVVLWANS